MMIGTLREGLHDLYRQIEKGETSQDEAVRAALELFGSYMADPSIQTTITKMLNASLQRQNRDTKFVKFQDLDGELRQQLTSEISGLKLTGPYSRRRKAATKKRLEGLGLRPTDIAKLLSGELT
jgi:hypothetical protein